MLIKACYSRRIIAMRAIFVASQPTSNMAKRDVTYTSTTVSKTHIDILNQVKAYAQDTLKVVLTSQQVNDFALEMASKHREELKDFVAKNVRDPEVEAFLKMKAKLEAAGKLPK